MPEPTQPAPAPAATAAAGAPAAPAAAAPAGDAAATAPVQPQSPATPASLDADMDADYEAFAKGQGTAAGAATGTDTAAGAAPDDGSATSTTPAATATPAPLSDVDVQAIRRHGLDPDEIVALRALSPEQRGKWVANLDRRAKYTDQLQQQLKQLQGTGGDLPPDGTAPTTAAAPQAQAPGTQPAPDAAAMPAFDDAWKGVEKDLADAGMEQTAPPLRKAIEAYGSSLDQRTKQQIQPLVNVVNLLLDRLKEDDQAAAFEQMTLPEGIDKADPKVRESLLAEADLLMAGTFDLKTFNYRHALQRAATNLYHQQIQAADVARKKQAATAALRGSAEPSTRTPTTAAALSDDEFDDQLANAIINDDKAKIAQLTGG